MRGFAELSAVSGSDIGNFIDRPYVKDCLRSSVGLTDFLKDSVISINVVLHDGELILEYPQISCSGYTKGLKRSRFWQRLIKLPVDDVNWFYFDCEGASCPQPYPSIVQVSISDKAGCRPGTYHTVSCARSMLVSNCLDVDFEFSGSRLVGYASQLDARFFDMQKYEFISASESKARALREEITLSERVEFDPKSRGWMGLGSFSRFDARVWQV